MYRISKFVEFDMAHRIPDHKSKCFRLHGHRYRVTAECVSESLHLEGEQRGMALDFGFLKRGLMELIHDVCDHSTVFYIEDPILAPIFLNNLKTQPERDVLECLKTLESPLGIPLGDLLGTVAVNFVPTAENLAHWWHHVLEPFVERESKGLAVLEAIRVHETPTCVAEYIR